MIPKKKPIVFNLFQLSLLLLNFNTIVQHCTILQYTFVSKHLLFLLNTGHISYVICDIGLFIVVTYFEIYMSQCMRFPTMWYVRPAKPQISLRIRAV